MASGARRPIVAGNWKMNGTTASTAELAKIVDGARALTAVDVMVCPPATLLAGLAAAVAGEPVQIGGQDWHAAPDFAPSSAWARPAHSARMDRRWRWWTHSLTAQCRTAPARRGLSSPMSRSGRSAAG